ncbi:conserved hypothetical protein [Leishmania major strain Friedlin]|uniref:ApaG domain-containing protein n=1 Tax=Leishmania major TaxID=5664 RepID=Q4Q9D6_LEIMA|nr:conserved hypothetical protein [Leishmania major strain Friedlin]CAG9576342.1 Protein_of_unknown_function_(DUF525)_-_putative [Leishmania major strain Friedlin]CAJ04797.1 conserved hypothetical protein [Leishmania major strain Friedlin]|eukprot:XP_001684062.1 conserved hypothetical protein [Leishmania major strain Friedlin]
MHVARSAYRQLLRVGKEVSDRYADPNDMCFALFGVLVSRHDFINAGYGSTFPAILRTCFLRPSITGYPHDTASARTSAAFDALRRLNELKASNAAFRIRELRRVMSDAADQGSASTVAAASASTDATPTPLPSSAAAGQATAPSLSFASQGRTHTTAVTYPLDDEGVHLIRGSVLIERSSRRRIQNFTRHCVVCEPINMAFPPYRFCVPPEPSYLLAVRSEFALYAITDVLLALSATSIFNAHRHAYMSHHQQQQSAEIGQSLTNSGIRVSGGDEVTEDAPSRQEGAGNSSRRAKGVAVATAPLLKTRRFPTTREEVQELVRRIPTRTVIQTDVLEVEITTEYVCSNPSAATAASPSAAEHLAKQSRDGVFSSTTPLKQGAAADGCGGSASARTAVQGDDAKAYLFLYYVYIRNRGPLKNPKRWHAQVLSHHLVVIDAAQAQVLEMGRPGVVGNFPLLQPGASHCFESGATLSGPEGFLRGSIQVNLFNDAGEVMMLDAAIAPTRLTVEVTSAIGFTSSKNAKEELVQRNRDPSAQPPSGARAPEDGADREGKHSLSADGAAEASENDRDSSSKPKGGK